MLTLATILVAATIAAQPIHTICDRAIPERARALFTQSGVVVLSSGEAALLDPHDCTERWRQHLSPDSRTDRPAVILDDRLIVADGDSLAAFSLEAGQPLWRQKRGWVQQLSATPHLIAHITVRKQSKILRLDPATGDVLVQRITRASESMSEVSGVILDVQFPNESDGAGYVVVAYNADDLREIWRFRQTGAASFVTYDDVPYFTSSGSVFPIDLKSGRRGPRLPPTGPVDSMWGGSTRELETTDDVDGRSRLRRNDIGSGKAMWSTDVPFEVLNTLRSGDTLYVAGGTGLENDPHYVALIDWRDGTIRNVYGPTPFLFQWGVTSGSILATTWDDRFVCLTLKTN